MGKLYVAHLFRSALWALEIRCRKRPLKPSLALWESHVANKPFAGTYKNKTRETTNVKIFQSSVGPLQILKKGHGLHATFVGEVLSAN